MILWFLFLPIKCESTVLIGYVCGLWAGVHAYLFALWNLAALVGKQTQTHSRTHVQPDLVEFLVVTVRWVNWVDNFFANDVNAVKKLNYATEHVRWSRSWSWSWSILSDNNNNDRIPILHIQKQSHSGWWWWKSCRHSYQMGALVFTSARRCYYVYSLLYWLYRMFHWFRRASTQSIHHIKYLFNLQHVYLCALCSVSILLILWFYYYYYYCDKIVSKSVGRFSRAYTHGRRTQPHVNSCTDCPVVYQTTTATAAPEIVSVYMVFALNLCACVLEWKRATMLKTNSMDIHRLSNSVATAATAATATLQIEKCPKSVFIFKSFN